MEYHTSNNKTLHITPSKLTSQSGTKHTNSVTILARWISQTAIHMCMYRARGPSAWVYILTEMYFFIVFVVCEVQCVFIYLSFITCHKHKEINNNDLYFYYLD